MGQWDTSVLGSFCNRGTRQYQDLSAIMGQWDTQYEDLSAIMGQWDTSALGSFCIRGTVGHLSTRIFP